MCGRYTQTKPLREVLPQFGVPAEAAPHGLPPRYNIAPSQDVLAVRADDAGHRFADYLRWGLVPFWAKDTRIGYKLINARAEGVANKPAYRAAFRQRRCLLPADGFYEWRREGRAKQPYYIRRRDGQPFAFAGLWERWQHNGETIESCTLITTRPNEFMQPIHDRMPVILAPEDYELWLESEQNPLLLEQLLRPVANDLLEAYPVSTAVNKPGNEGEALVEPIDTNASHRLL